MSFIFLFWKNKNQRRNMKRQRKQRSPSGRSGSAEPRCVQHLFQLVLRLPCHHEGPRLRRRITQDTLASGTCQSVEPCAVGMWWWWSPEHSRRDSSSDESHTYTCVCLFVYSEEKYTNTCCCYNVVVGMAHVSLAAREDHKCCLTSVQLHCVKSIEFITRTLQDGSYQENKTNQPTNQRTVIGADAHLLRWLTLSLVCRR